MRITAPVNEHEAPRNVGLLFFSDEPEQWFPGARIAVAQFAANRAGEVLDERIFRGPLAAQLRFCLRHLEGLSQTHIISLPTEQGRKEPANHQYDDRQTQPRSDSA